MDSFSAFEADRKDTLSVSLFCVSMFQMCTAHGGPTRRCSAMPVDQCSVREVALQSAPRISGHHRQIPQHALGAVLSVFVSIQDPLSHSNTSCQIRSHDSFCLRFGYACYAFTADTEQWAAERGGSLKGIHPPRMAGWVKVQAMRTVLPLHAWVLYLDADVYIDGRARGTVEDELRRLPSNVSVLVPHGRAEKLNSDTLLVRNTQWGRSFLEHTWAMRRVCSNLFDQGGIGVAVFHAFVQRAAENGLSTLNVSRVLRDHAEQVCCLPLALCDHSYARGHRIDVPPTEFCAAKWLSAAANASILTGAAYAGVAWSDTMRASLGLNHPVKDYIKNASWMYRQPAHPDNATSALRASPALRNCLPWGEPPAVMVGLHCQRLALLAAPSEWEDARCRYFGRANALRLVNKLNASSEYVARAWEL